MLSNNGAPLSNTPLKSEQCCSVRAMGDMVEGKVYRVGSRVGSLDVRLLVEPPPAVVPLLPCSLSLPVLHTEARVAVQLIGCEACASCVHWTPIPCPACHMWPTHWLCRPLHPWCPHSHCTHSASSCCRSPPNLHPAWPIACWASPDWLRPCGTSDPCCPGGWNTPSPKTTEALPSPSYHDCPLSLKGPYAVSSHFTIIIIVIILYIKLFLLKLLCALSSDLIETATYILFNYATAFYANRVLLLVFNWLLTYFLQQKSFNVIFFS